MIAHRPDPNDPGEFIATVGWIVRCSCGADHVAGYPCPKESA